MVRIFRIEHASTGNGRFKMIYITGDCHNNFERFNTRNFPEQKEMTKDDYVIICGDFGGCGTKMGKARWKRVLLTGWTAKHLLHYLLTETMRILTACMPIRWKKRFGRQPDLKNGFLDIIMIIET